MLVHHLVDLLVIHGVAHLAAPGTSGLTNSEMILPIPQVTSGGTLSAVDTVVQGCDDPRRLCNYADDDDGRSPESEVLGFVKHTCTRQTP